MPTISIINQKGGTGKTTTAINLSAALAQQGKRTLLIDLDPQAHATIGLGLEPAEVKATMYEVFTEPRPSLKSILQDTAYERLSLAPSHIKLAAGVEQLYARMFRERILSDAIKNIRSAYDYILIDCPPNLGVLTANALYASDFVLIPCQMSRYSLESLSDLLQTIEEVWLRGHEEKKKGTLWRILLTMYEKRNSVTNEYVEQRLIPYKGHVLETRISKNEALNQAHLAGQPIFYFDPKSRGAEDYLHLTEEILKIHGK